MSFSQNMPLFRALKCNIHLPRIPFHLYNRNYCQSGTGESFVPFDMLVSQRRNEARRSLLVEVAGLPSAADLHQVCSQYGTVRKMFHYTTRHSNVNKEMILVEFSEAESLAKALQSTRSPPTDRIIPVHSPFVWLSASRTTSPSSKTANARSSTDIVQETVPTDEELRLQLFQSGDVSEQIQKSYECQKLTELGSRLRFFTCRQVEVALSGLFPQASVLPFGSSVNSFGRFNCDLDMILELFDVGSQDSSQRLVFQAKKSRSAANPRITMQRHMEVISDVLDNFVPGCSQVRKILAARVPIIKYRQDLTDMECDLSMANRSGFYMSEMLYLYGSMDKRVRPLIFALRRWAKDRHITSPYAGRWVTNFSLTLLILFYLMRTSPPVIPPLQTLIKLAGADDIRTTESINCTFLRDLKILTASDNKQSLEDLLRGFFEFYDKFDFKERGLSIVKGDDFTKPEHNALYIQNPLERELNVSRNVTLEELERLRTEITHARYRLEEDVEQSKEEQRQQGWGLLSLWGASQQPQVQRGLNASIDWQEVFHIQEQGTLPTSNKQWNASPAGTATKSSEKVLNNGEKARNNTKFQPVERTKMLKEELIMPSDLNGLVTKLKRNVVQKGANGKKNKKQKMNKVLYKW
ncbi:poly(A) RNA polymerase, mitochondrial-like [Penaeus japonicus]|uniref:poly(A) RNA polymerase, mitochondrial-like n=1 Tax=Penaeus japonicus TaxID=27405 RepID=UPI001C70EB57|nr:poly(A) RNA polymerase, mitochondrial-like [Penaeus japonicus]